MKTSLLEQFQKELSNPVALVMRAAEGLAVNVFDALVQFTELNENQLAAFINVTPGIIRYYRVRDCKLGRAGSEQILQLLALYERGHTLFGSSGAFNGWLRQPALGLGGIIPFDLLYTPGGINLVTEELIRIECGALA